MTKKHRLPLFKRLIAHAGFRLALTFFASLLVRVLFFSSKILGRIELRVPPESQSIMTGETQAIMCFWHGRMLFMPFYKPRPRGMRVLMSHHRDGSLTTDLMRWFDIGTVRGSSSRGARDAVRALVDVAANGENISFTPDGPRGPYQVAAPGVIWVAMKTGLPITCVSFSSSRRKHAKSWDKFLIPGPFGRVIVTCTAPVYVPSDTDEATLEVYRQQMESTLRDLTAALDMEVDAKT